MRRSPFAMSNKIGSLERQLMDAFDEEEGINRQDNQTENAFTGRRKTKFPYTRRWRKVRKNRWKMARASRKANR